MNTMLSSSLSLVWRLVNFLELRMNFLELVEKWIIL